MMYIVGFILGKLHKFMRRRLEENCGLYKAVKKIA